MRLEVVHGLLEAVLDPSVHWLTGNRGRHQHRFGLGDLPGGEHRLHAHARVVVDGRNFEKIVMSPATGNACRIRTAAMIVGREETLQQRAIFKTTPQRKSNRFKQVTPLPLPHRIG